MISVDWRSDGEDTNTTVFDEKKLNDSERERCWFTEIVSSPTLRPSHRLSALTTEIYQYPDI